MICGVAGKENAYYCRRYQVGATCGYLECALCRPGEYCLDGIFRGVLYTFRFDQDLFPEDLVTLQQLRLLCPGTDPPSQDRKRKPLLPGAWVLDAAIPAPLPLLAVTVPLPDSLDLQTSFVQPLLAKELPHTLPAGVKPSDDPTPRSLVSFQEPVDRLEEVIMLPGHPETITDQDTVKSMMSSAVAFLFH